MTAFYNEIDPFAARWLRNLIAAGHIAPGIVDERDIRDITPSELRGFTQCHFFAGIGVWSYALRLAGWPDDRPIWTGSCPCQPFSAAGKGGGFDDERHLWPAWQYLIHECGPSEVAGEQVASKDGYAWLDLVQADMEGMGYACGAVVSPSAGYGAPHERHRQFFGAYRGVFHATSDRRQQWRTEPGGRGVVGGCGSMWLADAEGKRGRTGLCNSGPDRIGSTFNSDGGTTGVVGNSHDARLEGLGLGYQTATGQRQGSLRPASETGEFGVVADAEGGNACAERQQCGGEQRQFAANCRVIDHGPTGPTNGFWRDADWLKCRDDKWRPVEPGTQQMVDGSTASLGRVCTDDVEVLEFEIAQWALKYQTDEREGLRNLWEYLRSEALCERSSGRFYGIFEAPFLLAFLRQLSNQGWRFAFGNECASSEESETVLRVLQYEHETGNPSRRRELEQQRSEQLTDSLRNLSQIVAYSAENAWCYTGWQSAVEISPLAHNTFSRVGRLRGYGNAINAHQAKAFIEAFRDTIDGTSDIAGTLTHG